MQTGRRRRIVGMLCQLILLAISIFLLVRNIQRNGLDFRGGVLAIVVGMLSGLLIADLVLSGRRFFRFAVANISACACVSVYSICEGWFPPPLGSYIRRGPADDKFGFAVVRGILGVVATFPFSAPILAFQELLFRGLFAEWFPRGVFVDKTGRSWAAKPRTDWKLPRNAGRRFVIHPDGVLELQLRMLGTGEGAVEGLQAHFGLRETAVQRSWLDWIEQAGLRIDVQHTLDNVPRNWLTPEGFRVIRFGVLRTGDGDHLEGIPALIAENATPIPHRFLLYPRAKNRLPWLLRWWDYEEDPFPRLERPEIYTRADRNEAGRDAEDRCQVSTDLREAGRVPRPDSRETAAARAERRSGRLLDHRLRRHRRHFQAPGFQPQFVRQLVRFPVGCDISAEMSAGRTGE